MSKWTEIRDGALEAMKQGALDVAEETKQQFLSDFLETGVPIIEEYATLFVTKVKEQAQSEDGWNKIRDAVVIPAAVRIGLYVGKQILQLVQSHTAVATA